MQIKIETPYEENVFDLPAEKVSILIRQASKYAESNNKPRTTETILIGKGYICKKTKEWRREEISMLAVGSNKSKRGNEIG